MRGFWKTVPSAVLVLLALAHCSATESPPDPPQNKPHVQLMTSLPLVWGDDVSMESILSGGSEPAPIYRYWQRRYDIAAVDSLENLVRDDPDILVLAQPRAMDPADLSALDAWVRSGGDVIVLTDPDLVWPSELPLGDPRRPLASGLLSPLLGHWGLELVGADAGSSDVVELSLGDHRLYTRGVGTVTPIAAKSASAERCNSIAGGFVVQCSVGRGQASIVADADFLNAALWAEETRRFPQKSGAALFIDSLVDDHIDPAGHKK